MHVWVASAVPPPPAFQQCWSLLADDERVRADRYRFARDRDRFVAARGFLRLLLARYTGASPAAIRFDLSAHGKPSLAGLARPSFNLSHSQDAVVCALANGPVGIDVEHVRPLPDALEVAERFFSPEELAALREVSPERLDRCFFTCWTRKEAFVKGTGQGLSWPLDRFSVSVDPEAPLALRGEATEGWTVMDIEAGPGYVGALAVERRRATVTRRGWEY